MPSVYLMVGYSRMCHTCGLFPYVSHPWVILSRSAHRGLLSPVLHRGLFPSVPHLWVIPVSSTPVGYTSRHTCGLYLSSHRWVILPAQQRGLFSLLNNVVILPVLHPWVILPVLHPWVILPSVINTVGYSPVREQQRCTYCSFLLKAHPCPPDPC